MRTFAFLLVGAVVLAGFVVAWSTMAQAEMITGQLVDLNCYSMNKELRGNFHPGRGLICAQACAREGFPVGLVAADGKVYQVAGGLAANLNAKLVPHMSHTVTITGPLSQKNGTAVIASDELTVVSKGTE